MLRRSRLLRPTAPPLTLACALACALLALVPSLALAHDGEDHGASTAASEGASLERRVTAMATTMRIEALRTTAPRAVRGECARTVDVPGQGDSCVLPGGMWGVVRADGTTAPTHGPDVFAGTSPNPDLEPTQIAALQSAGDLVANPDDDDYVTCTTNPRVPHTKVVFASPAAADTPNGLALDQSAEDATVEHVRSAIRQASDFVRTQALLDGQDPAAGNGVTFRVLCDATGTIDVHVVDMPELGDDPDFEDIEAAVKAAPGVIGADDAGRVVAYYPVDAYGAAGQGWQFDDSTLRRDNYNNDDNTFAVHYLVNDANDPHDTTDVDADTGLRTGGVEWDVFLHEMLHNMGAVYSGPRAGSTRAVAPREPDANGFGHCRTDADVMCYSERGIATYEKCQYLQLDCGHDTYFNASSVVPGTNWLAGRWNVGHVMNRYLDFGLRTNADIVGPTRVGGIAASSPSANVLDVAWAPATDLTGPVKYDACYGVTSPSRCISTTGLAARFVSVPAGAQQVWLQAYDGVSNPSVLSDPVAVNVAAPPVVNSGTGGTGGSSTPKVTTTPTVVMPPVTNATPVAPGAVLVDSLGLGRATVSWGVVGAPSSTQWRVEVNREDIGAWSFATALSSSSTATIPLAPGVVTKVRVYAQTRLGAARSNPILITSPTRGTTCTWSAADTTPPTAPGKPAASVRTSKSVKAAFRAASDASGVCAIRVFVRANAKGAWRRVAILPGTARTVTAAGLKPRTRYQIALEATDARGNVRRSTLTTSTR